MVWLIIIKFNETTKCSVLQTLTLVFSASVVLCWWHHVYLLWTCINLSQVANGCEYVEGFKCLRLLNLEYNCIEAWEELLKLSKLERSVYIPMNILQLSISPSVMTLCAAFLMMVDWSSFKLAITNWVRYSIQLVKLRMRWRSLLLYTVSSLVCF